MSINNQIEEEINDLLADTTYPLSSKEIREKLSFRRSEEEIRSALRSMVERDIVYGSPKGKEKVYILRNDIEENPVEAVDKYSGFYDKLESELVDIRQRQKELDDTVKKAVKISKDANKLMNSIYINIISMMAVFVTVFSLIVVNFSAYKGFNVKEIIALEVALVVTIGIVLWFVKKLIIKPLKDNITSLEELREE